MVSRLPLIGLLVLLLVPAPLMAGDPESGSPSVFQEGQIWGASSGRPVSFETLLDTLGSMDVIYVGEEHHNGRHIEVARRILTALVAQGLRPALALEMFGWDAQPSLDRYLAENDWPREVFLEEARWKANWGGDFEDYAPLPALARAQGLSLLALNPPRSLVRLVATQGLAQALNNPDMTRWGMRYESFPEDPAYHDMIVAPLRQCHDGLSDDAYRRMYEASLFRDEGMAKTIAGFLRRNRGPLLSYTGGGHIQYRLPVPARVARRSESSVKQATVYLTSFEPSRTEEIRRLLQESVADYLWLTPLGEHGALRRCGS